MGPICFILQVSARCSREARCLVSSLVYVLYLVSSYNVFIYTDCARAAGLHCMVRGWAPGWGSRGRAAPAFALSVYWQSSLASPCRVTMAEHDIPSQDVLVLVDGGIGELVLNRPQRKNALSPSLVVALTTGLRELITNPEVTVILIRGNGPEPTAEEPTSRWLCSGVDLKEQARVR
eukprot:COSAG02_NODE_24519_length_685_cov_1.911263_1_plen_176_part_10